MTHEQMLQLRLQHAELFSRMLRWLDAAEERTLTLVSANADFDGPAHMIEFSCGGMPRRVTGETREDCMTEIERVADGIET